MRKYAFGVDLGGTTVKMGLFETDGTLLDTWEIPTRTEDGGKYILKDIADSINERLDESNISKADVEGIGMGVPGPVGADGTVYKCVNLGWGVFNVEEELGKLSELKVKAGNDANVAALGEMWKGGGKGFTDIVMVTLGTGVGGGIIINERILAGATGAAGEIGHIPTMDDEEEVCGCGKRGCLEQYTSATGIVRLCKRYLTANPDVETTLTMECSAKDVCDAAKAGDAVGIAVVEQLGKILGKGLAQVACVVNPQAFVIGGGMAKAGMILIEAIQKNYVENAFHASRNAEFKLAELGNSAGIFGGVKLTLD